MRRRPSLRRRLMIGLTAYLVLLTAGVLANDMLVNQRAEGLVWESLLEVELNHFLSRRDADPNYQWQSTRILDLYEIRDGEPGDPALLALPEGIYDKVEIEGRERAVHVHDHRGARFVLALDITDLEAAEGQVRRGVFLSALGSVLLLGLLAAWGATRLTRPLTTLADEIRSLRPESARRRVAVPEGSTAELIVIAEAINGYNERIESYIERESEFIHMASHELRTPLSVISGAVNLAGAAADLPKPVANQLVRAKNTLRDVDELVALLLVLAKNPERLADAAEPLPLHLLILDTAAELRPLATGKGLSIDLAAVEECRILASPPLVKSAVANLLRNAIEHTHDGTIVVELRRPGVVTIVNPGGGAPTEALSRIYSHLARGGGREGGGIGLALIARLCRHCGWHLSVTEDDGVRMSLDFGVNQTS
jgi:signal transduction histidine kinase